MLAGESDTPMPAWRARFALALSDIKLAHSVFALPFAVLAAFLSAPRHASSEGEMGRIDWRTFGVQLVLIVVCMFFARTWAMLVNRIADAGFDAGNPRTARRAIARGSLSRRDAILIAGATGVAFCAAASLFWFAGKNPWPPMLCVPVLAWIALYSFTKRFTWLCHLFLGSALAASPIAATIAINPTMAFDPLSRDGGASVYLLSLFVLLWVAGFDIIYALQDIEFDRSRGLFSVPAAFGWRNAAWISRSLHVCALVSLLCAITLAPRLGTMTFAGAALVAALLLIEHITLARRGLAGLPMAFFTYNGIISVTLGALASIDAIR